MVSFLECPHKAADSFTAYCPDCGYNIYTTKEEYLASLEKKLLEDRCRELEERIQRGK